MGISMFISRGARRPLGVAACASVLAGFGSHSAAIIIRHDVDPSVHLAFGADPGFSSVGEVGFVRQDGAFVGASGVLVARDWVLTAAHRVAQDPDFEWAFKLNGTIHAAEEIIYHPGYDGNALGRSGQDLALIRLAAPVTDTAAAVLSSAPMDYGQEVALVGFGGIGDGNGNGWTFTTQRWAATNVWDRGPTHPEYYQTDFDRPQNGALALEGSFTNGDAGGGVFQFVNNRWELAGLASHTLDSNVNGMSGDYGDRGRHTRLDVYLPWIQSHIPGPSSTAVIGFMTLACIRRQRPSS